MLGIIQDNHGLTHLRAAPVCAPYLWHEPLIVAENSFLPTPSREYPAGLIPVLKASNTEKIQ